MNYPIVLNKDADCDYVVVVVPDLPGCFSAGKTVDEALAIANFPFARYSRVGGLGVGQWHVERVWEDEHGEPVHPH